MYLTASLRCMLETGPSQKSIEFTGRDTFLTLLVDTDSMFEDIADSFTLAGCCKDCHRPRAVGEFALEIGEIALMKHLWFHIGFCL